MSTAVRIVCGGDAAARRRQLDRWLARREPGARWLVMRPADVGAEPGAPFDAGVALATLGNDCPCCSGAVGMRTALVRALGAQPADVLLLDAGGAALPGALLDLLRAQVLPLAVETVVAVLGADRLAAGDAMTRPVLRAQLEAADRVVVTGVQDPAGTAATLRALADALPVAPVLTLESASASESASESALAAESEPELVPDSDPGGVNAPDGYAPGWPAARAAVTGGTAVLRLDWPADAVFDRAAVHARLQALARCDGVLALAAVFRTPRDWYGFRSNGDQAEWTSSGYRLRSLLQVQTSLSAGPTLPAAATLRAELDRLRLDPAAGRTGPG